MEFGPLTITEPMTLATDYVLAALAVVFGRRLLAQSDARPILDWGFGFIALAIGSFAGGTAHGFAADLGELGQALTWKLTVYSIGLSVYFMLAGTARAALSPKTARWVVALAGVKLAVYLAWMTGHDDFRYVIWDYAPTMFAVLGLGVWLSAARRNHGGLYLAAGVLVSFAGAAVQQSGVSLHRHFNQNDLYHVIQMGGLWLFYLGARRLETENSLEVP